MSGAGLELSSSEITFKPLKFILCLCTYFDLSLLCFVRCVMEIFRLEEPSKTMESNPAWPRPPPRPQVPHPRPVLLQTDAARQSVLTATAGSGGAGLLAGWQRSCVTVSGFRCSCQHLWCGSQQIPSLECCSRGWSSSAVSVGGSCGCCPWISAGTGRPTKGM